MTAAEQQLYYVTTICSEYVIKIIMMITKSQVTI